MAKILVTGQHLGSTSALADPARTLMQRGHDLTIYTTGDDSQVKGFQDLPYERVEPEDHKGLLKGHDLLLAGLSGQATHDGAFIRAANALGMPSIGVNEINQSWPDRLSCLEGENLDGIPSLITVTGTSEIETMQSTLPEMIAAIAVERVRFIGWTAYDNFPQLKKSFTPQDRDRTLKAISHSPDQPLYFHGTQNTSPPKRPEFLPYEQSLTHAVLDVAQRIGMQLLVKPHPGEKDSPDPGFTEKVTREYGHRFIPSDACETRDLVLSADTVTIGRSNLLLDACLLDRNTGAFLPDVPEDYIQGSLPPVSLEAIPVARTWEEIPQLFYTLTDPQNQTNLAENRKRFSTDGKASERLANLVETMVR
ncbi:hypothetical protein CMI47_15270 [Candidatus Pacearchaeota archaeon]|nr:hypothetical protein [Candidatus Pacearchaeota archaeon]|tara:strand:- start:70 stop:1164 length:1095 start_codon:yes stop_codon:yes gene_type:complete